MWADVGPIEPRLVQTPLLSGNPSQSVSEPSQHCSHLRRAVLLDEQQFHQLLLRCNDLCRRSVRIYAPVPAPDQEPVSRHVVAPDCRVVCGMNGATANPSLGGLSDLMSHRRGHRCQNSVSPGASAQAILGINLIDEEGFEEPADVTQGGQRDEAP